jgi:hypothetical protein
MNIVGRMVWITVVSTVSSQLALVSECKAQNNASINYIFAAPNQTDPAVEKNVTVNGVNSVTVSDSGHYEKPSNESSPASFTGSIFGSLGVSTPQGAPVPPQGAGLMRLTAEAQDTDDTTYSSPPSISYTRFEVAEFATWHDVLHLNTDITTDTVYLQFKVEGSLSASLRANWPSDLVAGIGTSVPANASAFIELFVSSPYKNGAAYYQVVANMNANHVAEITTSSFGMDSLGQGLNGNGFSGIALLPVAVAGDPTAIPVDITAWVDTAAVNGNAGADLGHTISFLGVTDAAGNPIPGATFDSGLTPAVPEPSSLALLAFGGMVGGMHLITRRGVSARNASAFRSLTPSERRNCH